MMRLGGQMNNYIKYVKNLIKLANKFDSMGLEKEADLLDDATGIIIKSKSIGISKDKKDLNDTTLDEQAS